MNYFFYFFLHIILRNYFAILFVTYKFNINNEICQICVVNFIDKKNSIVVYIFFVLLRVAV